MIVPISTIPCRNLRHLPVDLVMRKLLDDIPEIKGLQKSLEEFVSELFGKDLKEEFMRAVGGNQYKPEEERLIERFVVCGLDVMVDNDHNFYVLEVNRNPGVPPAAAIAKEPRFQSHLIQFAKDLYEQLKLDFPQSSHGFVRL